MKSIPPKSERDETRASIERSITDAVAKFQTEARRVNDRVRRKRKPAKPAAESSIPPPSR